MKIRPHSRIGRVRYKKNPQVSVLIPAPPGLPEKTLSALHGYLDQLWSSLETEGVAGLMMVAWNMKGRYVRSGYIHVDSPVTQTLAPSFVAEALRSDLTIELAHEVLDGRLR